MRNGARRGISHCERRYLVVPANAGTHTPRPTEGAHWKTAPVQQSTVGVGQRRASTTAPSSMDHAVWVPAFAGTTTKIGRHLRPDVLAEIFDRGLGSALAMRNVERVEADLDDAERAQNHR